MIHYSLFTIHYSLSLFTIHYHYSLSLFIIILNSQTQASRSAPLHLLKIIQKFPEIIDDLKAILETLLDENAVDISNLENEEVSECLVSLLGSLGIKEGEDGN